MQLIALDHGKTRKVVKTKRMLMLEKMMVLFLLMFIRWLMVKLKVVSNENCKVLSAIVINIATPAMILSY